MKKIIVFATIFAMVAIANAQQFTPNEKGEMNAMTLEVRSLMERTDKVIIETSADRLKADKKIAEAAEELKKVATDNRAKPLEILEAKMDYISAIGNAMSARRPAGEAVHKTAMAYFDNVDAIVKAKAKLANDGYGDWQAKVLPATRFTLPTDHEELMNKADEALKSAQKRDEKISQEIRADFAEMQRRERELREKITK